MPEDNITVNKLLDEDDLKDLADKIVSEELDNIIIIYRDKKAHRVCWETTVKEWATVFGEMDMADVLMRGQWSGENQEDEDDG